MHRKTYVVPLRDMMSKFFPASDPAKKCDSDNIPNIFTEVPKFLSEEGMKEYVIQRLNTSKLFTNMEFVALSCESNHASYDHTTKVTSCDTQEESRRTMIWRLNHSLLVVCKLNPVNEDSSDEGFQDNKLENDRSMEGLDQMPPCVEFAFKYQQRQFIFVVFFLDYHARVVRFDRSGIIASEKIDYTKCGSYLTEFFVRYSRLQPADRGHDPTATRILPTDSLASQLKQRGADAAEQDSEDHVQKLFNKSLDPQWPWWKLSVPDEESGVTHWFAVGKPHFCADGVVGRGTRGYVAAPLNAKGDGVDPQAKVVYLKDAWRVDQEEMEKEGMVLKALNDAKVPYVPTLLYHGDLEQKTMSYKLWPDFNKAETHEGCPLKSHQHYRLVVAEVGKPLSEFENGFQLVWALFCCISAHEKACEAGYIHRDISAGNILLYKGASGQWVGLLNDWELSKKFTEGATTFGGRQLDRTGTWQFMSVHVLLKPTRLVGIPDDLESFLHVLIYFAVRFLPHNLPDDLVGRFLYSYFDDYTDGAPGFTCGLLKYTAIKRGLIDLTTITGQAVDAEGNDMTHPLTFFTAHADAEGEDDSVVPGQSHPIDAIIAELFEAFQALYAKEDAVAVRFTDKKSRGMSLPPSVTGLVQQMKAKRSQHEGASTSTSASRTRSTDNAILADKVKAHEPMKMLILEHFDEQKWKWPEHDKGKDKKPREGYDVPAKENTAMALAFQTGSKRGAEDGEEPNSKRVRNRA